MSLINVIRLTADANRLASRAPARPPRASAITRSASASPALRRP
jgi:hypothetical protein